MNQKPEITFTPFTEDDEEEGFSEDRIAWVHATMDIRFSDDGESCVELAERLLTHFRENGTEPFSLPGRVWIFHDDETLPPSVFGNKLGENETGLPEWLQTITDVYRKTEATKLLDELDRLQRLIHAVESSDPDSCFTKEENEHRQASRIVQDQVFGSRDELRELLDAARDALRHYAAGADPEPARAVLTFIGER